MINGRDHHGRKLAGWIPPLVLARTTPGQNSYASKLVGPSLGARDSGRMSKRASWFVSGIDFMWMAGESKDGRAIRRAGCPSKRPVGGLASERKGCQA